MIGVSCKYQALGRKLRPMPQGQHRSYGIGCWGVLYHLPEITIVMLVRLWQITGGQASQVSTNTLLVVSVWAGGERCRRWLNTAIGAGREYHTLPPLAAAIARGPDVGRPSAHRQMSALR